MPTDDISLRVSLGMLVRIVSAELFDTMRNSETSLNTQVTREIPRINGLVPCTLCVRCASKHSEVPWNTWVVIGDLCFGSKVAE